MLNEVSSVVRPAMTIPCAASPDATMVGRLRGAQSVSDTCQRLAAVVSQTVEERYVVLVLVMLTLAKLL
jgi:hypothetical protein